MSVISSRAPETPAAPAVSVSPWQPGPRAALAVDLTLAVFVVAMLALMFALPGQEAAPFHVMFLALAIAYGYRVWPVVPTVSVILAITVLSGWLMVSHVSDGALAQAELAEIPLMPLVLLTMVWHAQRRAAALHQVEQMAGTQLAGAERQREFLRDASHAIRTPVTIARGHLELAAASELPADVQADLAVALHQLDRMSALSKRLLALARLDSGDALRCQPTDLAELVEELGHDWSSTAARSWTVESDRTGIVLVDPEWIGHAVDALLENAVHFTEENGPIRLSCRQTESTCTIVVADSGPGIAVEDLPRIFDRFWHRLSPNGPMGSGLGLSIAQAAATAHGGSLSAHHDPAGGAVFELAIPVSRPADA